LILDPEIMDGSYKISGGGNGGQIGLTTGLMFGLLLGTNPTTVAAALASPVFQAYLLTVVVMLTFLAAYDAIQGQGTSLGCFVVGFLNGLGLGLAAAGIVGLPFKVISGQVLSYMGGVIGLSLLSGSLPGVVECGIALP